MNIVFMILTIMLCTNNKKHEFQQLLKFMFSNQSTINDIGDYFVSQYIDTNHLHFLDIDHF